MAGGAGLGQATAFAPQLSHGKPEFKAEGVCTTVSVAKGARGFGMKITMDGTVQAYSSGESVASDAGVVVGSKIVSVNGTPTPDKKAIAAALPTGAPEGTAVNFGFQLPGAKPKPPKPEKPKPPKPSEGVPPGGEDVWGGVAAALAGAGGLRSLNLSDNDLLADDGLAALAALVLAGDALPALAELGLARCGLGEGGLRTVAALMAAPDDRQCLCSVDIGGNHLTGSLVEGVRFGREGRGALYQFGELKLRR